jgi:hypothetical protein
MFDTILLAAVAGQVQDRVSEVGVCIDLGLLAWRSAPR